MNFWFWNHNRFETRVINFVGHGLSLTFTLFPDTTNWHHGVLWQLNNHLHTTYKCLVNACILSVRANRLNKSIYTLYILTHYHGIRKNRMLYFLFFFFTIFILNEDQTVQIRKVIFIQLRLKEGTFPTHFFSLEFWGKIQSKKISNDQELIQSDPISCPQNQKGNN